MARRYGVEYPERALMSVISDLLGIRHFTTSNGSTVRKDFLVAVGEALGVPGAAAMNKDPLLAAVVEAATGVSMDPSLFSSGTTVTDAALQRIIDGLIARGVPGRLPPDPGPPPPSAAEVEDMFDPSLLTDERDRRLVLIARREGRDVFRSTVLEAYGSRCAVTGFDAVDALEAAHIYPYRGPATNSVSNGLCLRADIHRLFDRGAISVHETTLAVLVKPHLLVTRYADLEDLVLTVPKEGRLRPSVAALRSHREWAGL